MNKPRRVYANPESPESCPILALAIYLMCDKFDKKDPHLFYGSDQYSRYLKEMHALFDKETSPVHKQMELWGMLEVIKYLATHSVRKGGMSTAQSISPDGPSVTSCGQRGAWKQLIGAGNPGTASRYFFGLEPGSDEFLGRILSLLDLGSELFASLPPHFICDQADHPDLPVMLRAIELVFPTAPKSMKRPVLKNLLATVVFHSEWMLKTMPHNHPVFASPLFAEAGLLQKLRPLVQAGLSSPFMTATGIPTNIGLMRVVKQMCDKIDKLPEAYETLRQRIMANIEEAFEKRAIDTGTITPAGAAHMITAALQASDFEQMRADVAFLRANMQPLPAVDAAQTSTASAADVSTPDFLFKWDTDLQFAKPSHHVPQTFKEIKAMPLIDAFVLYCCGQHTFGIGPFRYFQPKLDFVTVNGRKRCHEFLFICGKVEDECRRLGIWPADDIVKSTGDAHHLFAQAESVVAIQETRKRRQPTIKWTTLAKMFRGHKKACPGADPVADTDVLMADYEI
jgi:hypothetical protein